MTYRPEALTAADETDVRIAPQHTMRWIRQERQRIRQRETMIRWQLMCLLAALFLMSFWQAGLDARERRAAGSVTAGNSNAR